ncbi:glycoside hydrolase family 17 protein [Zopfia rhizophila CBS 207.26]|uniref:Probable glucan endo-1,3-beta-glucosidase eglC n=1 Tax=Zopfia rhizophila CBS 207.26 TaxID=1314779 RepID=A0A6A6DVN5_9PEZI|nr:glycoside hydrolase family 17 protein [Zopfia rhizophila CBS 207.26]
MRFLTSLLLSAAAASAQNQLRGFNYGAQFLNDAPKRQVDFEYEFNAAKQLPGTNGQFTSARLYTMVQWQTTNTVIEAIQAAINTKTTLLLGLWASAGAATFDNEIVALKAAIQQFGSAFTDLVVGISVGSEDLYRISPTGIENKSGPGANPNELVRYIQLTRDAIRNTGLAGKPIGHVDTWTAYVNASNNAVIEALDFVGVDAYPYFQTTMENGIENGNKTFYDAFDATVAAARGKPVWVTETGWPVSGPQQNKAVASADNARIYWEDVSCSLMSKGINLYYYTLQDAQWGTPSPSFGVKPAGDLMQVQPLFDLSCPANAPTLFDFNVSIEAVSKTCNLVFYLPVDGHEWRAPYRILEPRVIIVSQLNNPSTYASNFRNTGMLAINGVPCQAGENVGYQLDSLRGLDWEFFQTTAPALGLFMTISG